MLKNIIGLTFLLLVILSSFSANTQEKKDSKDTLIIATELWPTYYTQEDGQGLYQQILAKVFTDWHISYVYSSYDISKTLVQKKQAHLWLGAYKDEEKFALTPDEAFDADEIAVVYLGERTKADLLAGLKVESVGWQQGYDYHLYLPEFNGRYYEAPNIDIGINMLKAGRINFYLADFDDASNYLAESVHSNLKLNLYEHAQINLYPAFYNDELGRRLAKQWDEKIKAMKLDGSLKALFELFNDDYLLE